MSASKKQKVSAEERVFLFSSESVNEGHPDKLADQVTGAATGCVLFIFSTSSDSTLDLFSEIAPGLNHWTYISGC